MAKRFIICTGFLFLNFSITVFAQSSLTNLLQSLIEKEQKYQILEDSLTAVQKNNDQDNPNNQTTNLLENLRAEKSKIHRELLFVKSEILESEKPEPVWVEGEGEIVLDEKKPFEQSRSFDHTWTDERNRPEKQPDAVHTLVRPVYNPPPPFR